MDDIAIAVGLTHILSGSVLLLISVGKFSRDAESYTRGVMNASGLTFILLDRHDLEEIAQKPSNFVSIIERQCRQGRML
jgi:hypothetical protein